jgi:2-polyprenyl-6-hydroxyphenyl methylase/3-demethylubiquinone-9 3-methyltransferase
VNTQANVDTAEVARFDALAARWWDPNSEFRPLHEINPLRLDYVDERVGLAGKTVLDVGCGGGIFAEAMVTRGATVCGIDMGEEGLTVAKLHRLESGVEIDYQLSTAEAYAHDHADGFDVVTCLEMLEHVPSPESVIAACARLVKPGGHVFFSTINRNPKSYLFAILGAEYILHLLPKGTHDYARFIRPSELDRWARNCGLSSQHMVGLGYNLLTKVYALGRDVDVNYITHYQRPPSSADESDHRSV